jgi:hypothetical protein
MIGTTSKPSWTSFTRQGKPQLSFDYAEEEAKDSGKGL